MPREIADSDAESDLNSPKRPSASPITEVVDDVPPLCTLEEDPFVNLEFDQFLSPTQRLPPVRERQEDLHAPSASSTDRFLQDIAQADEDLLNSRGNNYNLDGSSDHPLDTVSRGTAKRTMSDIEHGLSKRKHDSELNHKSVKRTKTYGSTRSQKSDTISLFPDSSDNHNERTGYSDKTQWPIDNATESSELQVLQLAGPESARTSGAAEDALKTSHSTWNRPGATSFLQGNISTNFNTSNSVGGYAGINMDFRGAGLTIDANTNPFGSLSQVSLDGDVNPSQNERFARLFHHSQQSVHFASEENTDTQPPSQLSHLKEMVTSPPEKISPESGESYVSSQIRLEDGAHGLVTPTTMVSNQEHTSDGALDLELLEPKKKKRGRKPKNDTTKLKASEPVQEVDLELLQSTVPPLSQDGQHTDSTRRSRAGTVDSVQSHASHMSLSRDDKTGKLRKSSKLSTTEEAAGKQLSSELNLSDPAMIGAPKEMYVPRPSKSRSRRVMGDEEDELQNPDDSNLDKTPAKPKEATQKSSVKSKPGKKSKVKRAKTSAAAFLKSAEMYDEDDRDCILLDEMPAKIKMASIPEISPLKKEPENDTPPKKSDHSHISEADEDKILPQPRSDIQITVDIPQIAAPAEPSDIIESNPAPKKRGRKPKKKPEVQAEPATHEPQEIETHQPLNNTPPTNPPPARQALSEKDPNTPSFTLNPPVSPPNPNSSTPSPPKPVHSPLKPILPTHTTTTPTTTTSLWSKPRIGLSRRTAIPSLLRKLDRSKEPPKVTERKEKLSKRQQEEEDRRRLEAEDAGEEYVEKWDLRGKDGMLLEWDE